MYTRKIPESAKELKEYSGALNGLWESIAGL